MQLGNLVQRRDLLGGLADVLELGVEHDHELLPPVLAAVHRLEQGDHPLAMLVVNDQTLEHAHRAVPAGARLEHVLVLIERGRDVLEVVLEHVSEPQPQLADLGGRARTRQARLVQLHQLVPQRALAI